MGTVTAIFDDKHNDERKVIMIDKKYCTSVRNRTFMSMGIQVGHEITCEEMKELENFHWKKTYGEDSWKKEKVRLDAVSVLIRAVRDDIEVKETGFGAGQTEFLAMHPEEAGSPDLTLYKDSEACMYVEVTGTENKRGIYYWVRPDKIEYFQNHPEKKIWIVLYFNNEDQYVFIKPEMNKEYHFEEIEIRGAIEHYVIFNDSDSEVKTKDEFITEIQAL